MSLGKAIRKGDIKVSLMYDSIPWGVPVGEDINPEPSSLWGRVAISLPRSL